MVMKDWILPILIGFVAAIALISILYNNTRVKQAFSDIGALMQLNSDKPYAIPVDSYDTKKISGGGGGDSSNNIYNYYPQTPFILG